MTKIVDAMVADFEKANPDIKVKAIYSGGYQDTITKILTALKGGDAPQVAVALSTDMFTLIDEDAIIPYDDLVKGEAGKSWFSSFYPAFMQNSQTGGKTWGIPFQRSTVVLYWNKDAFKAAGLDPEKAPATWDEMREFATKLTKRDASGNVSQWGIEIPSGGSFPYWLFQGLATQNGAILMNEEGTKVAFDKPAVVEALQYWVDLTSKDKVAPSGLVEWGTTPKDFFEGKTAMMWTTTGNLTNVRDNAKFPFGVAMLPAKLRRGTPTGGGNFYLFKKSTPEQNAAAVKFVRVHDEPGAGGAMVDRHGLYRRLAGGLRDQGAQGLCRELSAGGRGARSASIRGRRVLDARQSARHQGLRRQSPGGADRHEIASPSPEGCPGRGRKALAVLSIVQETTRRLEP